MAPVRRNVTSLPAETVAAPTGQGRKLSRRPSKAVAAERKAHAMKRHAEKASRAQIAAELGISAETVKTWMLDKVAFPPHPVEPAAPDPRLVTAAALRGEGKSIADVAAAIGVPKPTLAGGCAPTASAFRSATVPPARAVAARRRISGSAPAPEVAERSIEVDEAPVPVDAAPVSAPIATDPVDDTSAADAVAALFDAEIDEVDDRPLDDQAWRPSHAGAPITLMQFSNRVCKWPVQLNDAGAQLFCGAPSLAGKSWCEAHAVRATGAGSSAERAAHKLSRLTTGA